MKLADTDKDHAAVDPILFDEPMFNDEMDSFSLQMFHAFALIRKTIKSDIIQPSFFEPTKELSILLLDCVIEQ
jgi:hypothetical protein